MPRDSRDLLCPGRPIPSAPAHRGHDRCRQVPSPACFRSQLHSRRWQWPHPCSCWSSPSFPVNLQAQLIPQGPFPRRYAVWNTTQTLTARGFPQAGFAPCAHTHTYTPRAHTGHSRDFSRAKYEKRKGGKNPPLGNRKDRNTDCLIRP